MCEKCAYSGCSHDWLTWDAVSYRKGKACYRNGQKPTEQEEKNPGFCAGYVDEKFMKERKNK